MLVDLSILVVVYYELPKMVKIFFAIEAKSLAGFIAIIFNDFLGGPARGQWSYQSKSLGVTTYFDNINAKALLSFDKRVEACGKRV